MKLSTAQQNWLDVAKLSGYDRGFRHAATPTLCKLEELGLLERNPTTTGPRTLWRITDKGLKHA